MKSLLLLLGCVIGLSICQRSLPAAEGPAGEPYRSPYKIKFSYPVKELLSDIQQGQRGGPHDESSIPYADWNSQKVMKRWGAWGPPARHYLASADAENRPVEWQRERVIAAALQFQGYSYQHHHIPDWNPPPGWPSKETKSGQNGKGVDCSNFSSFVYNLSLGFKPNSGIKEQSEQLEIAGPGPDHTTQAQRIELPKTYTERVSVLRTADLLFVRSLKGEVSHVVLWIGPIGSAPDNAPLILDSHGTGIRDSHGAIIPNGIYLRPFLEKSWYNGSASHAVRILPDDMPRHTSRRTTR